MIANLMIGNETKLINKSIMKPFSIIIKGLALFTIVLLTFSCSKKRSGKAKILVFSKTAGYHHESIADGNDGYTKAGKPK